MIPPGFALTCPIHLDVRLVVMCTWFFGHAIQLFLCPSAFVRTGLVLYRYGSAALAVVLPLRRTPPAAVPGMPTYRTGVAWTFSHTAAPLTRSLLLPYLGLRISTCSAHLPAYLVAASRFAEPAVVRFADVTVPTYLAAQTENMAMLCSCRHAITARMLRGWTTRVHRQTPVSFCETATAGV